MTGDDVRGQKLGPGEDKDPSFAQKRAPILLILMSLISGCNWAAWEGLVVALEWKNGLSECHRRATFSLGVACSLVRAAPSSHRLPNTPNIKVDSISINLMHWGRVGMGWLLRLDGVNIGRRRGKKITILLR